MYKRQVIYQCNHKYKGGKPCSTPHVTEDQVKDAFVRAVNILLSEKEELSVNVQMVIAMPVSYTHLDVYKRQHKTISRNGGINMKELWNTAQVIFAAIGGWLGYFLGGCDGLLIALVVFVAVDYVTGVMCAISDKKLSSEVGFKGICRKVLIFLLVGIANILDVQVIGTGSVLRTAVIFFYLSNEGVSLLENAAHLGLPVPEKMKDILAQLHDRAEKEEN